MASININSENVIQACDRAIKTDIGLLSSISDEKPFFPASDEDFERVSKDMKIFSIRKLAEFSEKYGYHCLSIDHNDFSLIGEYLTIPKQDEK